MMATNEELPPAIASRLSEAARRELNEKPLGERMAALAVALDQPLKLFAKWPGRRVCRWRVS